MNIIELKKRLHIDNDLLSDEIVEYVNQRLERRNTTSYKKSLFAIINRFIITSPFYDFHDYRIFYCDFHNEIELDENPIETVNGDMICQSAYNEYYFTCDRCEEIEHCLLYTSPSPRDDR